MEKHERNVAAIAGQVRKFYDHKKAFRIYHGSTNSTRSLAFKKDEIVDISHLSHVLLVDRGSRRAYVEPNVPMDALVEATLKENLVPEVVMEFPGITVGGGFSGPSGESSSFKYGFFENTIESIEVVLANGKVVTASTTENPDLFEGSAGSFGTLGITTLLVVKLIEAKKYVHLDYRPVSSISQAIEDISMAINEPSSDFVDGIVFALDRALVMVGKLTNDTQAYIPTQTFTHARDPWFYIHAERLVDWNSPNLQSKSVTVPLTDYLFRYDRGAFWTGKYAFQYFVTPFNRITRWAFDSLMRTRVMYHALHASNMAGSYIVQDLGLPRSTAQEFIEHLDKTFGYYPLWLCPLRKGHRLSLSPYSNEAQDKETGRTKQMLLNIGVWGPGSPDHDTFVMQNRAIEQKLRELGGLKWMYARAYYTEDEFWQIYNRQYYEALRVKYDATTLPSVYDKIKVDLTSRRQPQGIWSAWPLSQVPEFWDIWPMSGVYGALRAAVGYYTPYGKEYILAK
jgi:Delta24-sterol reductase